MSNNNYWPLINCGLGFGTYYTAASAGPFNELVSGPTGASFAAFCAFIIKGSYQQYTIGEGNPPPEEWLWGNFDIDLKSGRGWSLSLRPSAAGQGQLMARAADGAGNIAATTTDITGPGFATPIGHIILAGLWFLSDVVRGGSFVSLSINGSVVNTILTAAPGYTPSPFAARLGADPITGGVINSPNIEFISCGYSPVTITPDDGSISNIGDYAAEAWRSFYSGFGMQSFVGQDAGLDWRHRYSMQSLAPGQTSDVTKNAGGAFVDFSPGTGYAPAGAVIPDIGNQGANPLFAFSLAPVQLNRTGTPKLYGAKNVPYYTPPALTFPVIP